MTRDRAHGDAEGGGETIHARPLLVALAVPLFVLAFAAVPTAGHAINSATLDPQVSADGTVVVETAFLETDGWVVLRGPSGAFVGHARVRQGSRVVTDVAVSVPADAWPAASEGALWIRPVTYAEDGDGEFDPDADRELVQFGGAPDPVPVARGEVPARVLAAGADPLDVGDGRLSVRRVALPADGHLVVRNATGGGDRDGDGRVLGSRALDRGTHRNVTVALADPPDGETSVSVVLHRDDGDGAFDGDEPPVEAGNRTVGTRVTVAPGGASDDAAVVTATPAGDGGSGLSDGVGAVLAAAVVTGLLGIAIGLAGIVGARRGWW